MGPGGPAIAESLWGVQRIQRLAASRVRFSFNDNYSNGAANARPYSLTQANPPKNSNYRERAGFSLGGPLVIPKIYNGREKTLFFLNYDLNRSRNPVDTFSTVPTLAERQGDFSGRNARLFMPPGMPGAGALIGSVLPVALISPAAAGLLAYIPSPNLPGTVQNYHLQTRVPNTSDRVNLRVMHTISSKLNLSAVYSVASSHSKSVSSFTDFTSNMNSLSQNAQLGLNQTWSRTFINSTTINWNRTATDTLNKFAYNNNIAGNLGITGISTSPINYGVPHIGFTNFTGLNDPIPALRHNQQYRFADNVTLIRRKHSIRTGMEFRRNQNNAITDPTARGDFTFTGLLTSQLDAQGQPVRGTGLDFADFLLGLPQSTNVRFGSSNTYFRYWSLIGFAQDDWRIHTRFSIMAGIRYELTPPWTELRNHLANLDINSTFTQVAVVTPGNSAPFSGSLPISLVRADSNNWAPRFGFAWRPKGLPKNTVIRGGYSWFYNGSAYGRISQSLANQPPWAQAQLRNSSATQLLTLTNGFPPQPPSAVQNTIAIDPNYRVGYAQIWNLSIENQYGRSWVTEITYTGTKGTRLDLLRSPNRSLTGGALGADQRRQIPDAAAFTYDQSGASSIYHALRTRLQRRMVRGMMAGVTYTFSKSIDNASSIGGGSQVMVQNDQNFDAERGLSSFDIRHQLTVNYAYELPFGERRRFLNHGKAAAIFGNWQFNGSTTGRSGGPYTARLLGTASNNSGTGNNFSERPDQVGDPNGGLRLPLNFFNTAAFALPAAGTFGNAGRNTIIGPGALTTNLALSKGIRFGKDQQRRLDIRWETQNTFNHPNYTGLSTVVNSATYGRVQGAGSMRTMDLNMRFSF